MGHRSSSTIWLTPSPSWDALTVSILILHRIPLFCISGGFTDGTGGLQTPRKERDTKKASLQLLHSLEFMTSQTWDIYRSDAGSTSWWAEFLPGMEHLLQVSYIPTIKISMVHHSNLCHPIRMLHVRLPLNLNISPLHDFFPSPTPPILFYLKSIINNAWSNIRTLAAKLMNKKCAGLAHKTRAY